MVLSYGPTSFKAVGERGSGENLCTRKVYKHKRQAAELVRKRANALDVCYQCVERDASNRTTNRNAVVAANMCSERRLPILVGRLLVQQWPRARARCLRSAALPAPSTSSTVAAQRSVRHLPV